jgi:hypothetical protein
LHLSDEKGIRVTDYQHPRWLSSGVISSSAAVLGALGAVLVLLSVAPSAASASQARLFSGSFGEASSTPADPYPLLEANSVAVDSSSHDVYVADNKNNHRVEKFDSSGHFLFMLGLEVNKTAVEESSTRKAEEDVCPATGHPGDVCQAGSPGASAGAFLEPQFLAVDNSADPSKGDLYVANTGEVNEVQRVTVSATGGTFTLGFAGETTEPIAFNAQPGIQSAGSIEAALKARPKMDGIRSGGSPGKFTLEFVTISESAELGGRNVPAVACNGSALSGSGASCVVETVTQGFSANLVEKFDSSGQPVTSWGEAGELDAAGITSPPAPVAGPFRQVHGIAVDPSGNLWVDAGIFPGSVFEFGNDGGFLTGWTGETGELAVDAMDNLYFSSGPVRQFTSVGEEIGVVAPSATELVQDNFGGGDEALDVATDSLYVAGHEGFEQAGTQRGVVKRYDLSTCHPVVTFEPPAPGCGAVESFGAGLLSPNSFSGHPIAVDPSTDALYVADSDKGRVTSFSFLTVPDVVSTKPTGPTSSSATLTGTVNPSGVELNTGLTGCRFEWGETTAPYEHSAPCDKTAAQIGTGSTPVEVHAAIGGLQAGRTYHYRIVASNANDVNASITEPSVGLDITFGPPHLENVSALDVAATSATMQAQVDPDDLETRIRLEYGVEAGVYPQSTSVLDVGSGGTLQAVPLELTGLLPGTVYHYRVVAENVLGEGSEAVISPDHTFTTQTASTFSLPDNRGWELVSPIAKHGAIIKAPSGQEPIQAAADGSAISYTSSSPTEANAAGNADKVQVLSVRSAGGWSTRDIATPNAVSHGGGTPPEYRVFSSDLSLGVLEPEGAFSPEISQEASEQTPYLRTDFPAGNVSALCTVDCYRPLVTGAPGFANVPPGTIFGGSGSIIRGGNVRGSRVGFEGASPDARHIVVSSNAALVEGAPEGSLYEWTEGRLEAINYLPGGAGFAGSSRLGAPGRERTAVSADGSRVVWSASQTGHLYLRDVSAEQTLEIDLNQGGSGIGIVRAEFKVASPDGSVVLFTDEQQLTPDSGAAAGHRDLYRCQVITGESGELECLLTDLSPANGAEAASVQGMVGASTDGSSVYFVAKGVLAHNQVDYGAGPEEAAAGGCSAGLFEAQTTATCNLYLYREGTTSFIARLSLNDNDFSGGPARVSASGQWLALMSQRSLTGYDNRDRGSGTPVAEVYLYNAAAGSAGTMLCVSCNPSGARPFGEEYHELEAFVGGGINDIGAWDSRLFVAAFLPAAITAGEPGVSVYEPRSLSDSGRLFFNSVDGLVPQDSNGTEDVYEFEPPGVGGCSGAASTFAARSGGCVALVSSGASGQESVFVDASESGDDVFFLTAARLSPLDTDSAYDVYDARVGGGDREPEKSIECQGDACQGFVAPPNDATPDSLTFSGPGNLKPLAPAAPVPRSKPKPKPKRCSKAKKLKHGKCARAKKTSRRRQAAHKTTRTRRTK